MNHILLKSVFACLLLALTGVLSAAPALPTRTKGIGLSKVRIDRWPRYDSPDCIAPDEVRRETVSGRALLFPATRCGGYRLSTVPYELAAGQGYITRVRLNGVGKIKTTLTVFAVGKIVARKQVVLEPGRQQLSVEFAGADSRGKKAVLPHIARLEVSSRDAFSVEEFRIDVDGNADALPVVFSGELIPDQLPGIYKQDQPGQFIFSSADQALRHLAYRITDGLSGEVLAQDSLDLSKGPSTKITLFTQRRGFFDVQVVYGERLLASRGYVVLGDKVARSEDCIRYGLTMEHHGSHTRSDGQVPISDVYSLARQMGADTARIFSLAAPQMLSDDGMHYDFSQLDGALALMYSAGLEPFVLLGSDKIGALPGWLRTDKPSVNSVNLVGGTRNAGRKKQLQSLEGGHYLNLDSYADYLHEVFTHLTGRGITYSIWNEPGHKFTVSDIIRIGQITAEVRDVVDTSASIAGYSSSTGPDDKGRRNLRTQPGFLRRVSDVGGLDIIDVLSFHSGHILNYLGPDFDQRNPDTGFVDRLREVIDLDDRGSLPIWDTERGTPWRSRHAGRVDRRLPDEMDDPLHREGDWLEPTRRLPALYASAIAEGVERMYWFSFDASSHAPEELPKRIRAMFDAGWEPMPHVAAYAALTELLGCADYRKTIEAENGDLAWVFSDGELTTVLAYNWQGNDGILQVNRPCKEVGIYDVMGNTLEGDISGTGCSISTGVWMTYVKTRVGNDRTFQAHFAGRGKK